MMVITVPCVFGIEKIKLSTGLRGQRHSDHHGSNMPIPHHNSIVTLILTKGRVRIRASDNSCSLRVCAEHYWAGVLLSFDVGRLTYLSTKPFMSMIYIVKMILYSLTVSTQVQ